MKIAVSYLASYYSKEKTISLINRTDADFIHVDLMDGGFVPRKNFLIEDVGRLFKNNEKSLDIHLMVFDPIIYINDLARIKPEYITFHIEATKEIVKTIEVIKAKGIKVGIAIKPATSILELMPYLSFIDMVLVMSVEPGEGGQTFIPSTLSKIEELKKIRENNNLSFLIEVDGGINKATIKDLNVDIVVSGSFVCKSKNYQEKINELKSK